MVRKLSAECRQLSAVIIVSTGHVGSADRPQRLPADGADNVHRCRLH